MKHSIMRLLGVTLLAMAAGSVKAEVVQDYTCTFTKPIVKDDLNMSISSGWGRIADTYTNGYGTVIQQSYTQSSSSGHNSTGRIEIGSETLGNIYTCKDMIVTPRVWGNVSLWCKSTLYSGGSNSRLYFYKVKLNEDGTYEVGEEYTAQRKTSMPNSSGLNWDEIVFTDLPEDSEYPFIGIHGSTASISDFKADYAEFEKKHSLRISNVRVNGPTTGIVCTPEGIANVTLDVTVMNVGDYDYDGTEEGMTFDVRLTGSDESLGTFAIGALGEGKTVTVSGCALKPLSFEQTGEKCTFDVTENLTGSTLTSSEAKIREYRSELHFRLDGAYSDLADDYIFNFGPCKSAKSAKFTVNGQKGTAEAVVTEIKAPQGFSVTLDLPATISTTGTKPFSVSFDPTDLAPGTYSGTIEFIEESGKSTPFAVSAYVVDPEMIFLDMEDEAVPGEVVNGTGNSAWKVSYASSNGIKNYYLQPTSSYSDAVLTLPKLTFTDEQGLLIDARRTGSSAKLEFAYSTDRQNWTTLDDATLTMNSTPGLTYDFTSFEIKGVPAGDYFMRITGKEVYIDNITGLKYADVPHDIEIAEAKFATKGMVNQEYTVSVTLKNYNHKTEAAGSYSVVFLFGDQEFAVEETPEILGDQQTATVSLSFTPHAAVTADGHVEVRFSDGMTMESLPVEITIAPETVDALKLIVPEDGTQVSPGAAYVLPFGQGPNVSSEQIYPASFINLPAGTKIDGISFSGYTTAAYSTHIEAWVALSDKEVQNSDATPIFNVDEITKVFEGDVTFEKGTTADPNFFKIPFDEEFEYDGTSSLVVYLRATSSNSSVYSFNFKVYNSNDSNKWTRYRYWNNDTGRTDNYYLGWASLNLVVENASVTGTVKEGDLPVEGAKVTLRSDNVEYYGTADEQGAFTIEVLQSGRDYTASLEAEGFNTSDATEISFSENKNLTIDFALLASSTSLDAENYETIVLLDPTNAPEGTYFELKEIQGNEIIFIEIADRSLLEAHKPYLVKTNENVVLDLTELTLEHQAQTHDVEGASLIGTYASHILNEGEYLPGDVIAFDAEPIGYRAPAAETVKVAHPAGAYLVTDILNPVVKLRNASTGIENVAAETEGQASAVYTIDGRCINTTGSTKGLSSGIYIINGKKVAIGK